MKYRPTNETPEQVIARVGWMVQYVFACKGGDPSFFYTIGLADKGLPELVTFALPVEVGQYALNVLARRMADGEVLPLYTRLPDVLGSGDVMLIEAERAKADQFMFQARNRNGQYRALQVVWPDPRNNAMPWEDGYRIEYQPLQPLLGAARPQ